MSDIESARMHFEGMYIASVTQIDLEWTPVWIRCALCEGNLALREISIGCRYLVKTWSGYIWSVL